MPHRQNNRIALEQRSLLAIGEFNNSVISEGTEKHPDQFFELEVELKFLLEHLASSLEILSNAENFYVGLELEQIKLHGHFDGEDFTFVERPQQIKIDMEHPSKLSPWQFWYVLNVEDAMRKVGRKVTRLSTNQRWPENLQLTIYSLAEERGDWDFMMDHVSSQALLFGSFFALAESRYQAWKRMQTERRHEDYNKLYNKNEAITNHPWSSIHKGSRQAFEQLCKLKDHLQTFSTREMFYLAINIYDKTLLELLNLGRMIRVVDQGDIPKDLPDTFAVTSENLTPESKSSEEEQVQPSAMSVKSSHSLWQIFSSLEFFEVYALEHEFDWEKRRFEMFSISFQALFNRGDFVADFVNHVKHHIRDHESRKLSERVYELFNFWIFIEKSYRNVTNNLGSTSKAIEEAWHFTVMASLQTLGELLKDYLPHMNKSEKDANNTRFRNMLHLWFCYQHLLLVVKKQPNRIHASDLGAFRFRGNLAYVMREALRFEVFSPRSDFALNEATFITSLKALVEHYIHLEPEKGGQVGLPETYDVSRFLNELGQVWGVTSANSPLQYYNHVLHVFISGLFLLDISVKHGQNKALTIGERIIAPDMTASPDALRQFKQAYALAVLFHDVSHVVCPFEEGAGTSLISEKRLLKLNLASVEETLKRAGSGIAETCSKDLLTGHYLDPTADLTLRAWLKEQVDSGEPDHGLISAWYLHHLCEGDRIKPNEMLKQAVRAILVHNAVSEPITLEQDPVAAFLVLTNELFEWDLGSPFQMTPHDHFEQHPVLVSPDSLSPSRYRHMYIRDLETELVPFDEALKVEDESLPPLEKCQLSINIRDDQTWPHFFVQLQEAEYLDVPVMAIWLNKVQTFARFVPHQKCGWLPKLTIHNPQPPIKLQKGLTTVELLERLALSSKLSLRPHLKRWLTWCKQNNLFDKPNMSEDDSILGEMEAITISNLNYCDGQSNGKNHTEPFFYEDIRKWMPRLLQEAEELLRRGY